MKALGITAMIFAIVAIFVPLAGPYLTIVAALLAAFGAGPGLTFSVVAILINLLNVAFLSPSLWISVASVAGAVELTAAESQIEPGAATTAAFATVGVSFLFVQVVAGIVLAIIHVIWKGRQPQKA